MRCRRNHTSSSIKNCGQNDYECACIVRAVGSVYTVFMFLGEIVGRYLCCCVPQALTFATLYPQAELETPLHSMCWSSMHVWLCSFTSCSNSNSSTYFQLYLQPDCHIHNTYAPVFRCFSRTRTCSLKVSGKSTPRADSPEQRICQTPYLPTRWPCTSPGSTHPRRFGRSVLESQGSTNW